MKKSRSSLLQFILCMLLVAGPSAWRGPGSMVRGQSMNPKYYDMGQPVLTDIWVDPAQGNDSNDGRIRGRALRTVIEAWRRIPMGNTLTNSGYRITLAPGTYSPDTVPAYWELRHGTYLFPIIIQAADGAGTLRLRSMNFFDCRYVYLVGLNLESRAGDVLHFESCDHVLVRQTQVTGTGNIFNNESPQETLKVNQCQYVYVEDSDISGAWDNAVDFVAVQYGHIVGNRIHRAADWCIYLKGGSAYFRVEGNEIYDGGTGGFTAGQGTGFEFMVNPWLHYEAGDIKFINNIIHDTAGAGMGVNGGYNVFLAHNTLYRVGRRSHVIEAAFGLRGCDGATARCQGRLQAGGWGITSANREEPIPNRNVYIYNNVVYNPAGFRSESQHFAIYGPRVPGTGSNIPSPARTDTNLQIRGNVIWNGPASHPLGIEEPDQGCQPGNPTCNASQLRAENTINGTEPQLVNPSRGDYRPTAGSNLFQATTYVLPGFPGGDRAQPPLAPEGNLQNTLDRDRDGLPRSSPSPPGAYASGVTSAARIELAQPIVPRIDQALKDRLLTILAAGQRAGNRLNVFAKIGDSITESASFLWDLGCSVEQLGSYAELGPVTDYFRGAALPFRNTSFCRGDNPNSPFYNQNSFNRGSACAVAGWSADYALDPGQLDSTLAQACPAPFNAPLTCELHLLRPALALIMYGTNDLQRYNDLEGYRQHLTRIVSETIAAGVIPVLSTIPPRLDTDVERDIGARVAGYNRIIMEIAGANQLPLWNYWLALEGPEMINHGMDVDGIHPNVFRGGDAAVFTSEGLRYGYNQRNLTAVQVLAKIKQVVIDSGPPDR